MDNESDSALTGAAFELANAGYIPMREPDEKNEEGAIGSDSASLREAAERHSQSRGQIVTRQYTDDDGEPIPANEALTLDRAGRDYARAVAADKFAIENESGKVLAARIDALRAEAWANDPENAEMMGFERPQAKADKMDSDKVDSEKTKNESADANIGRAADGLDPTLEKALAHPQVRQAIEQQIGEAEKTRQGYLQGLEAAHHVAQISFVSQFPELAAIAPQHLPAALAQMSQQDPQKFARVKAMIANTDKLVAQRQHESLRQTEMAWQNFHALAKSEDARYETLIKGEPPATQKAVAAEIVASAKASGIDGAELYKLFNSEPLMRNAVFQRMMYDAGKYRLMMKARDTVSSKPVPPVQRPGMARTPAERAHTDLRTLTAKLSSSGDIKDAVALYNARKSSRR